MKVLPGRLLAFLALMFLGASGAPAAETLRLRADSWMPFNGDPAAEKPGYVVEVARIIFLKHDITVDYQTMPWADALKAAAAGEIEGVIGASRKEAEGLILPGENIGVAKIGLYVRKSNPWTFGSFASLKGVRLGAVEGYDYWEALDDYIHNHHAPDVIVFKGETPLKDAIAKLVAGELDVMPETISVFSWAVKNQGLQIADFRPAYVHQGDDAFVAFAAKDGAGARYAKLFDEGMQQLRQSGELARILEKYGLSDWK